MVTAVFAVLFAGATAFAVMTMYQSLVPAMNRLRFLATYARENDGSDWAWLSYQHQPVFVPAPPPGRDPAPAESPSVPQAAVPRWQSWCCTGYVTPPSVAAKWNRRSLQRRGTRCKSPWRARPAGKLCSIMPDSHSRVAEPSDYAALRSPPPHLSIGFLAAKAAAPSRHDAGQRLLA